MSQPKNLSARVAIASIKKRLEKLPEIDWFTGPRPNASLKGDYYDNPYILRLYKFEKGTLLHSNQRVCENIESVDIATFITYAPRDVKLLIEICEDLIDQIGI